MPREVPGSFGSIPLSWSEMRTTPVCSSPRARVETVMCTAARRLERWIIIMHSVVCYYKVDLKNALIAPGCLGGAKNNHKPRNKNVKANVERRCLRSAIDTTGHTVQTGKLVSTHWNTCKPAGCRLRK